MKPRMHWLWRVLITWIAGVASAVIGFLIYGQTVYQIIGFYESFPFNYNLAVSVLLVFAHGFVPTLVGIGVYHWLSAPRWDSDHTRCGPCGYILNGLTEPRCPECGSVI